jgi:hypothetical protein
MHPNNPGKPYYVIVTRCGEGTNPFCWEIQRRRLAMGVGWRPGEIVALRREGVFLRAPAERTAISAG